MFGLRSSFTIIWKNSRWNDWMQRYGQKHPKYPLKGYFPHFVTSKIFFQKSGPVTFVPLWYLNFMQSFRKTNEWFPRYLKTGNTDHGRTNKGDYYGPHRVNRGPKWKILTTDKIILIHWQKIFFVSSPIKDGQTIGQGRLLWTPSNKQSF